MNLYKGNPNSLDECVRLLAGLVVMQGCNTTLGRGTGRIRSPTLSWLKANLGYMLFCLRNKNLNLIKSRHICFGPMLSD